MNAAQEAVQPEGDADFSALIVKVAEFAEQIKIPVYVKEVGHGVSYDVAYALKGTNIKAIDVQGAGGTSWTAVDALRHKEGFGLAFREFGIPTAASVVAVKSALYGTDKKIIASGGIRTGLDAAKAIVLGANLTAAAMPVLQAQQKKGEEGIIHYLSGLKREMSITAFLLGCKNIKEMHEEKPLIMGKLNEWLSNKY